MADPRCVIQFGEPSPINSCDARRSARTIAQIPRKKNPAMSAGLLKGEELVDSYMAASWAFVWAIASTTQPQHNDETTGLR